MTTATGSPTKRTLSMASSAAGDGRVEVAGNGVEAEIGGGVDGDDAGHRQRLGRVDAE